MRRKVRLWPGSFDLTPLDSIRTIRRFDDVYTAPHHGFDGSADYYHRASAMRVVDRVRRPALILAAADDPMVPASQFDEASVRGNPNITVHIERYGGHCGFVGPNGTGVHYWAESVVLDFLSSAMD
jgi:hypothetical protein